MCRLSIEECRRHKMGKLLFPAKNMYYVQQGSQKAFDLIKYGKGDETSTNAYWGGGRYNSAHFRIRIDRVGACCIQSIPSGLHKRRQHILCYGWSLLFYRHVNRMEILYELNKYLHSTHTNNIFNKFIVCQWWKYTTILSQYEHQVLYNLAKLYLSTLFHRV